MAINNRYEPSHPQGQQCVYGLDFSTILPPGITITDGQLALFFNTVPPGPAEDFGIGPMILAGRRLYAQLEGGSAGSDYRLQWSATDSEGFVWIRTVLLLCAATS